MRASLLAVLNVTALRRRLIGLFLLISMAVALCVASFGVSDRSQTASHDEIEEGVVARSILLERLVQRDDTRTLSATHLRAVAAYRGVQAVEPVVQASFGYKDARVPGLLLYATTPRPSLLPPVVKAERASAFPLRPGEGLLPATSDGQSLTHLLGQKIQVEVTRTLGAGRGEGVSRTLRVVGFYDPSWQLDGPDAAYIGGDTVEEWAALRAGVPPAEFRESVGYDSATVVADSAAAVPELLDRLQSDGYAASSLQQQLASLPAVLELIRTAGTLLLVALVVLTGFGAYQVTAGLGRQRRREVGILKAVGFSDGAVFRMLSAEAVLLALAGSASGLLLSVGFATLGNQVLRRRGELHDFLAAGPVVPDVRTALIATVVVLAVVMLGAVAPALRAARLQPAEAIREW